MNPQQQPVRRHFVVAGRVQGVGFRAAARREATRLSLHGYVRNRADGSVEAEAEGDAPAVAAFAAWLARGPMFARVDDVREQDQPVLGDGHGFEVRH